MIRVITILSSVCLLSSCLFDEGERVQGYVYQEPIFMSSTQSGRLLTLDVERGQSVNAGQQLFVLDNQPEGYHLLATEKQLLQAQATLIDLEKASRETILEGLRGELQQAQANYDIARKKALRYEELLTRKVIDIESRDEAVADASETQAALASAKAHLAEAELGARVDAIKAQQALVDSLAAEVKSAQWALEQKTVYAPKNAFVVDTFYRPGENIAASHPVIQLYDPERLFAIFFISEPLLSEICIGQDVFVAHNKANKKTKAFISYISPEAEFTPPVIYSRENNQVLLFRIEATLPASEMKSFHSGQPIDVYVPKDKKCHE